MGMLRDAWGCTGMQFSRCVKGMVFAVLLLQNSNEEFSARITFVTNATFTICVVSKNLKND